MYIRTEMLLQYLQYCLHIRRAVAIAAHVNDDCEAEILGRIAASERWVRKVSSEYERYRET